MSKKLNLVNKKFNRLEVLAYNGTKNQHSIWKCKCDCGSIIIVKGIHLKSGHSKSCGCLEKELLIKRNSLDYGLASKRYLYGTYKRNARKRNLCFELNFDDFIKLTSANCFYCGVAPKNKIKRSINTNGEYNSNGIDRLNNTKGYLLTNCVSCCKICNRAKMDSNIEEFLEWIINLKINYDKIDGILKTLDVQKVSK